MRNFGIAVTTYMVVLLSMVLIVRPLTLPDEATGLVGNVSPVSAVLQETSGKRVLTDFLVDYASAHALRAGQDPYEIASRLIDRSGGPAWDVGHANPHPPTMIALLLPFSLLTYQNALSAWSVLMILALIWTVRLVGLRWALAIPIGLAVALTFPGAFGIGNPVPVIGLGIAFAYRYRHDPMMAAIGITMAAAPKSSGLLLLVPFLLMRRWKVLAWTAGFMVALALLPVLFYHRVWTTYLDAGTHAISLNFDRLDNASLLNLAHKHGIPTPVTVLFLGLVTVAVIIRIKDSYWPLAWLTVAALPIAWMYSLLTLIPIFIVALRRQNVWAVGSVALAAALTVGSPPLQMWPTRIFPIVMLLSLVALLQVREDDFWPTKESLVALVDRMRGSRHPAGEAAPASVDVGIDADVQPVRPLPN